MVDVDEDDILLLGNIHGNYILLTPEELALNIGLGRQADAFVAKQIRRIKKKHQNNKRHREKIRNEIMTLKKYQNAAMRTCMNTCMNFTYMMNGFVGEVGELASKIAKMRRHGILDIDKNRIMLNLEKDEDIVAFIDGMKHELGDCLWFIAGMCATMGWSLENVAQMNIAKLASRQQRGVIEGEGDNR